MLASLSLVIGEVGGCGCYDKALRELCLGQIRTVIVLDSNAFLCLIALTCCKRGDLEDQKVGHCTFCKCFIENNLNPKQLYIWPSPRRSVPGTSKP